MGTKATRLEMLEGLLAKGSVEPFHHYARAMELRSLDRPEDAVEAFAAVAEQFGKYVPTYLMAAQVCAQLERMEDALGWAQRGKVVAQQASDAHAEGELQDFIETL